MSFDKKSNKFDLDKLNLKDRLNASLENEGISVSEDLINRTLNAIKNQKADELDHVKENKKNNKPAFIIRKTRILVSAAAAVIILLVGMSAVRLMSSNKKADNEFMEFNYAGYAEKSDSAPQITTKSDASTELKADEELKIASDENNMLMEGTHEENVVDTGTNEKITQDQMNLASAFTSNEIGFAELAAIEASDAKSVLITSAASGKTVLFSEKDQVNRFYAIMENHTFIRETEGQSEGNYVIEITGQDRVSKIEIGTDIIKADTTDKEAVSHSIYSAVDHNRLIKELDELLQ
ncbi:MAG TPA: hypothetical protein PK304_05375 [Mobilitalea sp.]|nr:hypothetical protein [Mobilitalea sp.]